MNKNHVNLEAVHTHTHTRIPSSEKRCQPMIPKSNKPTSQKSYNLKGCTFSFVKKGNIVTMSGARSLVRSVSRKHILRFAIRRRV